MEAETVKQVIGQINERMDQHDQSMSLITEQLTKHLTSTVTQQVTENMMKNIMPQIDQ